MAKKNFDLSVKQKEKQMLIDELQKKIFVTNQVNTLQIKALTREKEQSIQIYTEHHRKMEEEFRRKIGKLTADHNRKVAEDDKKYLELVEEKTQLKTTFLQEISEKAHQNEESLIQMKINQNLQLQ